MYVVHDDALLESTMGRGPLIARWAASLRDGVEAVGPDSPAGVRVGTTLAYAEFIMDELDGMIKRWQEYKSELERGR